MIRARVLVSGDPTSLSRGAEATKLAIEAELSYYGLEDEIQVSYVGRVDRTDVLPVVLVYPEGTVYGPVTPEDGAYIVEEHLYKGRVVEHLLAPPEVMTGPIAHLPGRTGAAYAQKRVVLRRAGLIDPTEIEEYIAHDGYFALGKALTEMTPEEVLQTVKDSGLQGRGGAGFPTGLKWTFVLNQPGEKYIVCNADESEPGTFKDRLILEGDPHAILEGMALAGYAVGAHQGWIYIRGEYVMARERLTQAIQQAEAMGLLGDQIMDTDFSFHVHLHAGAGAYICGEETALLDSMEGKRGTPRIRPPYPTVAGFRAQPTVVNNVETLANVPPIILNGDAWFRSIGTKRSPGTKVYTMLGDVNITGLVEAPMGTTLREIIEIYGGGMKDGRAFKCAQTGGSSGSIIPADMLDVPMDFASMAEKGAALGSGALLVCDEDTSIVELAYVLVRFFKTESCGKCTPCRVGTSQMLESLERLRKGYANRADLERLEEIAGYVQQASFCGLGQAAPVPIITGLRYFREEFEAHVSGN
jgi:NADP-reducing hydrogenase subunit HndC